MDERKIRMIAEEAARLKKDNPALSFKEVLEIAKEELKDIKEGVKI